MQIFSNLALLASGKGSIEAEILCQQFYGCMNVKHEQVLAVLGHQFCKKKKKGLWGN